MIHWHGAWHTVRAHKALAQVVVADVLTISLLGLTQLLSFPNPTLSLPSPDNLPGHPLPATAGSQAPWAVIVHNTTLSHCLEVLNGNKQVSMVTQLEWGRVTTWSEAAPHTVGFQRTSVFRPQQAVQGFCSACTCPPPREAETRASYSAGRLVQGTPLGTGQERHPWSTCCGLAQCLRILLVTECHQTSSTTEGMAHGHPQHFMCINSVQARQEGCVCLISQMSKLRHQDCP